MEGNSAVSGKIVLGRNIINLLYMTMIVGCKTPCCTLLYRDIKPANSTMVLAQLHVAILSPHAHFLQGHGQTQQVFFATLTSA